MAAVNKNNQEE